MHPVETYLHACHGLRVEGCSARALHGPLAELLNAAGRALQPRVVCVMDATSGKAVHDGGLYVAAQVRRGAPLPGQVPSRGVIVCKDPAVRSLDSPRLWPKDCSGLLTNYREFIAYGAHVSGARIRHEHARLADSEAAFWALDPARVAAERGEVVLGFLRRTLMHFARFVEANELVWMLAGHALDARLRVLRAGEFPELKGVREGLERALGVAFASPKDPEGGSRNFRAMVVQVLYCGLVHAWLEWHRSGPAQYAAFEWQKAVKRHLRAPLRKLFGELADPAKEYAWRLGEVLEWSGYVLTRVHRGRYFEQVDEKQALAEVYAELIKESEPELMRGGGVDPAKVIEFVVG